MDNFYEKLSWGNTCIAKEKIRSFENHLITKGIISSWDAIKLYKATRLSAIIFNLRKNGMDIVSIPKSSIDENGNVCNYVDYKYVTKK